MSNTNSLSVLTAMLKPGGQQRLFEFLDGVDTDTAARFRGWLSTANDTQVGAVADLLDRAVHGREFAGWWRAHDKVPTPTAVRPPAAQHARSPVEDFQSQAGARTANRDLRIGGIWLVGGLLVTVVTYSMAVSSPKGGHFIVASGAILYGAVRLLRGLKAGG